MKKYIQPRIKQLMVKTSDPMLVISNSKGYGGPMANEGTFDDVEATLPKSKDIWE